jgi:hypothetical protein
MLLEAGKSQTMEWASAQLLGKTLCYSAHGSKLKSRGAHVEETNSKRKTCFIVTHSLGN